MNRLRNHGTNLLRAPSARRRCGQRSCGDKLRHRVSVTPPSHFIVDSRRRSAGTSYVTDVPSSNLVHLRGCSGWAFGRRVLSGLAGPAKELESRLRDHLVPHSVNPLTETLRRCLQNGTLRMPLALIPCRRPSPKTLNASTHAIISLLVRTSSRNCSQGF